MDTTGYGNYFQHPNPPSVNIVGGRGEKIVVMAPSVVNVYETFRIGVRIEDKYHNEAVGYCSKLKLFLKGEEVYDAKQEMNGSNSAVVKFNELKLEKEGVYFFEVRDETGLIGISNVIKCTQDKDEYRIFWGDIHGHLGYMDSVGTIDEYYNFAQNISFLDFVCHSEHMDSYSGDRQASNDMQWEIIKSGARKYDKPGEFAVLRGYENSEIWDANVYFYGEGENWHVDSYANRLFEFAKKNAAIVIPHMTTYPQRLRGYDWSNYDASVMPVVEIYSMHGSSEYFGGERPLKECEPGGYVVDALDRGYKLGFIGSADGHDCMPGNSAGGFYMNGLVAVYAKELTKEAVMDAIMNRRCYAATNARILGYFSINECMSGSELIMKQGEIAKIKVSIYGSGAIEQVHVIRNGVVIYTEVGNERITEFEIFDTPDRQGHNYYYIKIVQKDGEMAWLSPVFIELA